MTRNSRPSNEPTSPHPDIRDAHTLAAWLAGRRRAEPRLDLRSTVRVSDVLTALRATGVPFGARDVAELADVRTRAVSSALRSARLSGRITRLVLADPAERVRGGLWLGVGHEVPPGYRPDGPILF